MYNGRTACDTSVLLESIHYMHEVPTGYGCDTDLQSLFPAS